MNEFQKLIDEIMEFQTSTFPTSTPLSKLHHLQKEVKELIEECENPDSDAYSIHMEYADCFLLLIGSAAMAGLDGQTIFEIIRMKLDINRKRKWGKPDENGVVLHEK